MAREAFTLSAVAAGLDLPIRSLKYWIDRGALHVPPSETTQPRLLPKREVEVAALLRPFINLSPPIELVIFLAQVFRELVLDDDNADAEVVELVARAREGKPALLAAQVLKNLDWTGGYRVHILPLPTHPVSLPKLINSKPGDSFGPVVIIDLEAALRPLKRRSAIWANG